MTPAISAWIPEVNPAIDHGTLVVARRDPARPTEEDDPRQVATRVLEVVAAGDHATDVVSDFPVPLAEARPVRLPDGDEPSLRRDLWDALALRVDGSSREWSHFRRINRAFAAEAAAVAAPAGDVLIIANGLYLLPQELRRMRADLTITMVILEELPTLRSLVDRPAAVPLMSGMLGADIVWSGTEAEASRFEVAAVALDLAEPTGRSIVHVGRPVELRAG